MDETGLLARTELFPGDGRTLELDDALFAADAIILRDTASRGLTFEAGDARVGMTWDNLPDLGLWKKPGAPFLCIAGFNDPQGFAGKLDEKPGIVVLAPGSGWSASMSIQPV